MVKRIWIIYPHGLNKRFCLKFCVGSLVQHEAPEEGQRMYQPYFFEYNFFFVHCNLWGPSDQPYDWGRHPWVSRWQMRSICAQKSLGEWEQEMVMAVADVVVDFLSFLCCSVTVFLLVSQTFTPLVSVLRQIFKAIRSDTKRFHGDLLYVFEALFLASFEHLPWDSSPYSSFFLEAVIFYADNMTGPTKLWLHQDWEEKPELKLWYEGCVFAMWCWESFSDRLCQSGLASLYAVDKLSTFHCHKGEW